MALLFSQHHPIIRPVRLRRTAFHCLLIISAGLEVAWAVPKINALNEAGDLKSFKAWLQAEKIQDPAQLLDKLLDDDGMGESNRFAFTLMRSSGSDHKASPKKPRIILTNKDSSLLIAISGDPDDPAFNKVELIDYSRPQPDFVEMTFNAEGKQPPIIHDGASAPEKETCFECHTGNVIWDSYAYWPRNHSAGDRLSEAEAKELKDFVRISGKDSRYQRIALLLEKNGGLAEGSKFLFAVNERLNENFGKKMRERFQADLTSHAAYQKFKPLIQAITRRCSDLESYIPKGQRQGSRSVKELEEETLGRMNSYFEKQLTHSVAQKKVDGVRYELGKDDYKEIAQLRWVLEGEMEMDLKKYVGAKPRASYASWDGYLGSLDILSLRSNDEKSGDARGWFADCDVLKQRSLAAFSDAQPKQSSTPTRREHFQTQERMN